MPFVDLTYWVWSERLEGAIGGKQFSMRAVSGGGRGGSSPDNSLASYSPYRGPDKAKGQMGGTIPPGYYWVERPSKYAGLLGKPVAKLTPAIVVEPCPRDTFLGSLAMYGRDYEKEPFLIHGPGGQGSSGCIVIDHAHRKPLLDAVEQADGLILLRVTSEDRDGILDSPHASAIA